MGTLKTCLLTYLLIVPEATEMVGFFNMKSQYATASTRTSVSVVEKKTKPSVYLVGFPVMPGQPGRSTMLRYRCKSVVEALT